MRVALVFYGLLRYVDVCYPLWKKNVIDTLGIEDIYMHTFRDEKEDIKYNGSTGQHSYKVGPSVLRDFHDLYKPRVVMYSNYEDVKKTNQWFEPTERVRYCVSNTYNIQAICFSIYNAVNLVPDKYDYVILSKIDQVFWNPITKLEINDNEILTSNFMFYKDWDGKYWSATDFFAIGNLNTIKKYAALGINYKQLYENGITFHIETLVGENLKYMGVKPIVKFRYPEDQHYYRDHESLMN